MRERPDILRLRLRLILGVMLLAFGALVLQLWQIQVVRSSEFSSSLDRQSMRRVRLPGTRGRIFDRHGRCLADNRPMYCLAIYTEELRQRGRWSRTIDKVDGVIDELSEILGIERQVTRDDIALHVRRRLPLPFLAWRRLDEKALATWAESGRIFPGVDVYIEPERVYPYSMTASHIIGYVSRADPSAVGDVPYHYYLPEMEGREGIERAADDILRGRAGGRLIRVDASGFKHAEIGERDAVSGDDITLTLDLDIQAKAESLMHGYQGSIVVMDPRNGDILAMVSSPSYDRSALRSRAAWQALLDDPQRPLVNRAIAGRYPPGSVFKPLVALAGLVSNRIDLDTVLTCTGAHMIGNQSFRCWARRGHGDLSLQRAIEQSCNPYFIEVALRTEYQRVFHMAHSTGFGQQTGVELAGESAGLLPDDEWKRRVHRDAWRPGDTANVSIGQGALLVTPLQMARFTSALANGGRLLRPRLLMDEQRPQGDMVQKMAWDAPHLAVVRKGMEDVIHAERGTGRRARLEGVRMAGKTGTAQYGDGLTHAWMVLFAPSENARYAASIIVEDAESGGLTAAPILRELMSFVFRRDGTLPFSDAQASAGSELQQQEGGMP